MISFKFANISNFNLNLTLPIPIPDKKKKLTEIFIFPLPCGAQKGFMKALKAEIKM